MPGFPRSMSLGLALAVACSGWVGVAIAQPSGDACGFPIQITPGSYSGSTTQATVDGSCACGGVAGPDVWYRYSPSTSGTATISTCWAGTTYNTVLSVHTACPGTASNQIACNNDSCLSTSSSLSFNVSAGTVYLIRVSGYNGQRGNYQLQLGGPAGGGEPPQPPEPVGGGADVTLIDSDQTTNWGVVNGIRAYSMRSTTCNIGDADLLWDGSTNHHPILAQQAYRLYQGRLEQIGLSWCKHGTQSAALPGCGPCNGHDGAVLGAGCQDTYSANGNGNQSHLGPRSDINAFTGEYTFPPSFGADTGDAVYKRLQVHESDLLDSNFPGALYFIEGEWVAPDDAAAGHGLNNASYRRMWLDDNLGLFPFPNEPMRVGYPAIYAWQDHGGGAGVPDWQVNINPADVPGEGRFLVGSRAYDNGNGTWRYEYAVFNINSHRSGGWFSVPLPLGTSVSAPGFHDVDYHSGEPYDNTNWRSSVSAGEVRWTSPQTYAQNPNSNALRWGTLYNFRFTSSRAPGHGNVTLGLFRPGTPVSVTAGATVPGGGCPPDWNHDGTLTSEDFFDFIVDFFGNAGDYNGDGATNSQDVFDYLTAFIAGC